MCTNIKYPLTIALIMFLWIAMLGQTVNDCSYRPPRQGETWCFYSNLRLKFQGGAVTVSPLPSTMPFGKGCASLSDENGDLVLYSDGMMLWDQYSNRLSATLDGDLGATQSSLIVPNPSENTIFYIFTTHLLYPPPLVTKGLNYSTLNKATVTGLDTLPVKRLLDKTPEKLTGVRHSNLIDYWVVAHGWGDNTFYSYKVTSGGVDSVPVTSNAGVIHSGTLAQRNMVGAMKISPDGSKLAQAILGSNLIEWFDFNASSGKVSNLRTIPSPDAMSPYGVEFSPDGSKLFFTTVNPSTNLSNNLYQVDLTTGSPPVLLNRLSHDMTALQLAVDGKIYVARYNYGFLGVIENPNRPDTACNYIEDGLSLGGSKGLLGLPNIIQSYFNIPGVTYDTKCLGDDTYFYITNPSNIDSAFWSFGDPSTGAANFSNQVQPTHIFSTPGDYTVQLTEWFNNRSFISSHDITINPLPPKSFAEDSLYILPGSAIVLDAGEYMKTYSWLDGSSNRTLEVSEPGYYNVTIIDTNCCQQSDTIKVLLLDLFVPNAFSPNFDGTNDRFRIKGPTQGIANYRFVIYNRWGQLLWETDNFSDTWDGTFKGEPCPMGSYAWVMSFGVTGAVLNKDKIIKRGLVTIIR